MCWSAHRSCALGLVALTAAMHRRAPCRPSHRRGQHRCSPYAPPPATTARRSRGRRRARWCRPGCSGAAILPGILQNGLSSCRHQGYADKSNYQEPPMWTCERCGVQFEPKDQNSNHLKRNPPRFCSKRCHWQRYVTAEEVRCTQCGTAILRRRSHRALTRHPFCSFRCYGEWQRTHSKDPRPDLRQWKAHRLLALERDGHRCVDCGQTEKRLIAHHLSERMPGIPDDHELGNLVTLCDGCHVRRHRT